MRTAARVAQAKTIYPEQFCSFSKCLWRTNGGDCPRHIKRINAFCECCDRQDHGTPDELKGRGWLLLGFEQFCEFHRF